MIREKKWRKTLEKLLIFVPVIGNIISAVKIQELENMLEKEKNPSFEQAQQKVSTRIHFSDWDFYKHLAAPKIEYWPTWKEAIQHSYKVCSNGNFSAITDVGINNNFYMGLWNEKNPADSINNSHIFSHGGGVFDFEGRF